VVLVVLIASLGTFGYFAFFSDSPPWSGISGGGGTIEITSGPFVTVTDNTSSEVAIEWETDTLCKGQIEFGETTEYGSESTEESSLVKSHSISLPDLDPSTSYNYRLLMTDKKGNTTKSANKTFTSPQT
jgi:phosphodiesterase/alkaline phosphatase D-like protein